MTGSVFVKTCYDKYNGVPYVWGGEDTSGADCSGFVYMCLNNVAGYKVGRYTAQGYYNKFKSYATDVMITGDILFFGKSKSKITHIAFYYGDNKMLESGGGDSSNTAKNPGIGVRIRTVRSDLVAICRNPALTSLKPAQTGDEKDMLDMPLLKKGNKTYYTQLFEIIMHEMGYYPQKPDTTSILYGDNCVAACKKFQKVNGLTVDGQCGDNTWAKIIGKLRT